jgi:hypothetical protein
LNKTKQETFMKMFEVQAGLGFGVKKFSLVWVRDARGVPAGAGIGGGHLTYEDARRQAVPAWAAWEPDHPSAKPQRPVRNRLPEDLGGTSGGTRGRNRGSLPFRFLPIRKII